MKHIKPGQAYWHNGHLLRAKKRTDGCEGCVLNNPLLCPNIELKGQEKTGPDCVNDNIILVKF